MSVHPLADAALHQRHILDLLCCPRCRADVALVDQIEREGAIVKADIVCSSCGRVGLIDAYRLSFLERDLTDPSHFPGFVPEPVALRLATLASCGRWSQDGESLAGVGVGSEVGGIATGSALRFDFVQHPWSGRVRVAFGEHVEEIDLWAQETATFTHVVRADSDEERAWSVSIIDGAVGDTDQVIVRALAVYVDATRAEPLRFEAVNLGNPYPPRFEELLTDTAPEAFVLDLGGGDRRHPDLRVINLEYLPYLRVDLYGDGLSLPFRDGSFDFILSQAVLEHVPDPKRAVSEILRVLKPGALVYAEFAFMQPLHAVPFHYFNITPHGATLLFEAFEEVRISSFGGLGETMRWFFRLVGADVKLEPHVVGQVLAGLDSLDRQLGEGELAMLSSAVAVEARAPLR